jgi:hypothetical protein
LRGFGSYTGTLVSGDPNAYETISYRTDWQGVAGLDADPPVIETFTTSVRKLRRPLRTYVLRIGLTLRDASAPVLYKIDVRAGGAVLVSKQGSTASGPATTTLRLRAPRSARSVRVVIGARDALGTETDASRSVALR